MGERVLFADAERRALRLNAPIVVGDFTLADWTAGLSDAGGRVEP